MSTGFSKSDSATTFKEQVLRWSLPRVAGGVCGLLPCQAMWKQKLKFKPRCLVYSCLLLQVGLFRVQMTCVARAVCDFGLVAKLLLGTQILDWERAHTFGVPLTDVRLFTLEG